MDADIASLFKVVSILAETRYNNTIMLPDSEIAKRIHIVLVEPQDSLNIGSVARAMMNLGFNHLHLVRPKDFSIERALVTGRWAEELIHAARIHDSLSDALSSMQDVIGFSSNSRPHRGEPIPLPDWVSDTSKLPPGDTALLFGREDTGLSPEAIEQCRMLVRIPSRQEYPAFNLAQSVLLVMYELSRLVWLKIEQNDTTLPSWNQYEHLDRLCGEVMASSGFHRREEGDPTAALIKNLFRRMTMSEPEMRVMLALFNRVIIALQRQSNGS